MRIGMLLDQHFPPDVRVQKEARTLAKNGFDVNLLAIGDGSRPPVEQLDFLKVFRIFNHTRGKFLSDLGISIGRFTGFRMFLWEKHIEKFISDNSIDVLHVHDLPLFRSAYAVAGKFGIKVILDLHENYPHALREWKKLDRFAKLKLKILYPLSEWQKYECWAVKHAFRVVVVIEEMKERLIKLCRANSNRIAVVPNTESLDFLKLPLDSDIIQKYKNNFVLSYIGGIAPHRGVDVLIRAVTLVKNKMPELKVLIVGGGNILPRLKKMAASLGVDEIVEFIGYVPPDRVPSYIAASDIGVIPHIKNPHTDNTIPHKLFQYMMLGKPVAVSNCKPLKRLVEETGCGTVFESGNPDSLAQKILFLYHNGELMKDMGQRGKNATTEGGLNWETTSKPLVEIYRNIAP